MTTANSGFICCYQYGEHVVHALTIHLIQILTIFVAVVCSFYQNKYKIYLKTAIWSSVPGGMGLTSRTLPKQLHDMRNLIVHLRGFEENFI